MLQGDGKNPVRLPADGQLHGQVALQAYEVKTGTSSVSHLRVLQVTAWVAFFSTTCGASVSDLTDAPPRRAASAASYRKKCISLKQYKILYSKQ